MQRLAFLTVLVLAILAMLAANANAGKVTIRGQCVDCNRPGEESTTPKTSGSQDHASGQSKTAAAPSQASNSDISTQEISTPNRFKRQWG